MSHPAYEWRVHTAVDFFLSLQGIFNPDLAGLRPSWAAGVRSRLPQEAREFLAEILTYPWFPGRWLADLPAPFDARTALAALAEVPAADRLVTLLAAQPATPAIDRLLATVRTREGWNKTDLKLLQAEIGPKGTSRQTLTACLDLQARALARGEALLPALTIYYETFFVEEETRIIPFLEKAVAAGERLAQKIPFRALIEQLSQGVDYQPRSTVRRVIFAPSFWATPFIADIDMAPGTLFFVYGGRPSDQSLIPGDQIPSDLAIGLKSLADPTRLKILRLLIQEPMAPSEIARALRLRPATVTHHLRLLRQARLVRVSLSPEDRRVYTLRPNGLNQIVGLLQGFLDPGEAP